MPLFMLKLTKLDGQISTSYFGLEKELTIGKNDDSIVDISHDARNNISQKHLELKRENGDVYLRCCSKRGIFIDGLFHSKELEYMKLYNGYVFPILNVFFSCKLRFPSTTVELIIEVIEPSARVIHPKKRALMMLNHELHQDQKIHDSCPQSELIRDNIGQNCSDWTVSSEHNLSADGSPKLTNDTRPLSSSGYEALQTNGHQIKAPTEVDLSCVQLVTNSLHSSSSNESGDDDVFLSDPSGSDPGGEVVPCLSPSQVINDDTTTSAAPHQRATSDSRSSVKVGQIWQRENDNNNPLDLRPSLSDLIAVNQSPPPLSTLLAIQSTIPPINSSSQINSSTSSQSHVTTGDDDQAIGGVKKKKEIELPPHEAACCDVDSGEGYKPPYSYAQLIIQAIASSHNHRLTLADIYAFISTTYPYFKPRQRGWQNSIRHNLSLNRCFVRVPKNNGGPGKGAFWMLAPDCDTSQLVSQAFKPSRRHAASCGDIDDSVLSRSSSSQLRRRSSTGQRRLSWSSQLPSSSATLKRRPGDNVIDLSSGGAGGKRRTTQVGQSSSSVNNWHGDQVVNRTLERHHHHPYSPLMDVLNNHQPPQWLRQTRHFSSPSSLPTVECYPFSRLRSCLTNYQGDYCPKSAALPLPSQPHFTFDPPTVSPTLIGAIGEHHPQDVVDLAASTNHVPPPPAYNQLVSGISPSKRRHVSYCSTDIKQLTCGSPMLIGAPPPDNNQSRSALVMSYDPPYQATSNSKFIKLLDELIRTS